MELSKNIEHFIGQLSDHQKVKLSEFLESITTEKKKTKRDLLKFAGSIDQDDLELMEQAIAEGCEKIDAHEWSFYFENVANLELEKWQEFYVLSMR